MSQSRGVGRLVSVAQAAQLAHKSEHAVRNQITRGRLAVERGADGRMRIDPQALAAVPGWRVDETLLGRLDAPALQSLHGAEVARLTLTVATLERRVERLERRLERLERADRPPSEETGETSTPPADLPEPPVEREPRTVTLADRGAGRVLTFATAAAAARWLVRHGVHSEYTPRTWPGWPPRPLTREAVLTFAQALELEARARGNWRVTWRLRHCDDPLCVCQSQLTETRDEEETGEW